MNLTRKTILITGASSGIGEACAYAFAKAGAQLILAARNTQKLNTLCTNLQANGYAAFAFTCDVTQETDCQQAVEFALQKFGKLDVLINNAGISMRALFVDADIDVIKKVMDVNFYGAVYCTKYALPYLLKEKGSVIAISSFAGFKGLPGRTGYTASKFALNGFMDALRIENLNTGLHVGIVSPGYTQSNIRNTALNAKGEAQSESPLNENNLMPASEVAEEVLAMVQRRKYHVRLTFTTKLSFWLNQIFPKWVDRIVYKKVSKEKDSPFV